MSEEEAAASTWLTVAQAAAALGVSERQARRDAGHLAGHDKRRAGHGAGHDAGHGPLYVRLEALQALRAARPAAGASGPSSGHAPDMTPDTPDMRPDATPDTRRTSDTPDAGHRAGHAPPHVRRAQADAQVLAGAAVPSVEVELLRDALGREREQVAFLRAALEARDRDAAELRAALREALKISTRALPSPVEVRGPEPEKLDEVGRETREPAAEKLTQVDTGAREPQVLAASPPAAQERPQSAAQVEVEQVDAGHKNAPQKTPEREGGASTWERSRGFRAWLLRMLRG